MVREYLAQANTIFIIVFLLWRVETLQQLEEVIDETITDCDDEPKSASVAVPSNIGALLHDFCETPKLYLLHDLTLTQLSEIVGTNRTYLSCYFAQQGITYNAYINRLRIEHFERIYNESSSLMRPITANQLAYESGFKSYSTFATAFKLFKGQTVTDWMKSRNLQK
jgi:AraC-like DNA-binding protein